MSHRFRFVTRRVVYLVPLLLVVLFVVYAIVRIVPGSPAQALLGLAATPQRVAQVNHELGVDRPVLSGYLSYAKDTLEGNLGRSVKADEPVTSLISSRLPPTLWLLAAVALLSTSMALLLATLAALKPDGLVDQCVRAAGVLGLAVPSFWLGLILVSMIALPTGWFPVSGFGEGISGHLRSIILPAVTLSVALVPLQVRALRSGFLTALQSDYVAAARSVGIGERRVLLRHVLPNVALTAVTILAVQISALLFGMVVVENVFAIPGIGQALLTAVSQRDYPVVQGIALLSALLVVGVHLLADVIYVWLDPRVELA